MPFHLMHQVGHNSNWNVQSFEGGECGTGLILSPLHQSPAAIEGLSLDTRRLSLFDPQFYLPSSQKPRLLQYDFFPESLDGGFKTSTFEAKANEVARRCIAFQKRMEFDQVVIPTRYLDQMYSDYVDRQRQFTVDAFVEASDGNPMCLSLAVTSAMVEDHGFRTKLLNWITSYPNIDHIYLSYFHARDTKQIHNPNFLKACYRFFRDIVDTGLNLTVGYVNTEALLFSVSGEIGVTVRSFENTRMFSVDKFIVSEEERRGPKARIYLRGLLNWLQIDEAKLIRNKLPKLWSRIYDQTDYAEQVLAMPVDPTFNQPQLYKHYFICMQREAEALDALDVKARIDYLRGRISSAISIYDTLQRQQPLERHGRGTHLSAWLESLDTPG